MDILDLIKSANLPVVWALKGNSDIQPGHDVTIQILKYLVMQILRLNAAVLDTISASFNATVLQSATTEKDWFDILNTVTAGLSELYIVIDAELLQPDSKDHQWSSDFLQMLRYFIQRSKNTVVKVVLFSYRNFPEQDTFSKEKDVVLAEIKKSQRRGLTYPARAGSRIASRGGRASSTMQLARSIGSRQRATQS